MPPIVAGDGLSSLIPFARALLSLSLLRDAYTVETSHPICCAIAAWLMPAAASLRISSWSYRFLCPLALRPLSRHSRHVQARLEPFARILSSGTNSLPHTPQVLGVVICASNVIDRSSARATQASSVSRS